MNAAYKHLDAKLRIAELTLGQWTAVIAGVFFALGFGFYLHPFGSFLTTFVAIYIGGLPIAAVVLAGMAEFDAWLIVRSAARWRGIRGPFLPGPGALTPGYRILSVVDPRAPGADDPLPELDLGDLWGARR
jgi:hypothetical protein